MLCQAGEETRCDHDQKTLPYHRRQVIDHQSATACLMSGFFFFLNNFYHFLGGLG